MTHLRLDGLRRMLPFWRWRRVHRRGVVLLCRDGTHSGYTWTGQRLGVAGVDHLTRELTQPRRQRLHHVSASFRADLAERYGGHR